MRLNFAIAPMMVLLAPAAMAQGTCGLFEAVEPGDTFESIAARCGVSVDVLIAANPGQNPAAPAVAGVVALTVEDGGAVAAGSPAPPPDGPKIITLDGAESERKAADAAADPAPQEPAEVPEALDLYTELAGRWVIEGGVCADPAATWELTPATISASGETCTVDAADPTGAGLLLMATCRTGDTVTARRIELSPDGPERLAYVSGSGSGVLEFCGAL